MPSVHCRGVELYYEDAGSGDPVVWLPGTGLLGTTWEPQTSHFSEVYRCLTVDLPGAGRSSLPAEPTVREMALVVAELLDAIGVGSAHLVGLSLGSAVVQELALLRPDLVRSAVLVGTWSSSSREHHIRRHFESRLAALERGPLDVFGLFAFWMSAHSILDEEPELQRVVEDRLDAHTSRRPEGTASHFRADLGHETYDRLPAISCPTLVVHGDEDLITMPRYNRAVAAQVPGARLVTIPRAGHLVWIERPDELTAVIASFLDGVAAGVPANPSEKEMAT
ncbi:alpha/beta fold hydrolase [Nocardioides aquiterrae]|uniref:Alpha/beta hydrolase n=1 Tax=Nocardioides aquiterrae TaxID=203799 RepID=A0ABN1UD34_9ACTN